MAKPTIVPARQPVRKLKTTPGLIWLRCHDDGRIPAYVGTQEFPYESAYQLGESYRYAEEYRDAMQMKIIYKPFMNNLCASTFVAIIQKSFEISHLETIIDSIKTIRKEVQCSGPRKMVVLTDHCAAHKLSRNMSKGLFDLDIKSSLFVGNSEASTGKPFRSFHDRIVLLDEEIWHFGADVCGMHSSPYAFSGPWEDVDGMLRKFIDTIDH